MACFLWCHLTATCFDYFDDVQFLSFVAYAFAVIPNTPHYVDDFFAYDFVVLGFACLYLDRITTVWLRLASASPPSCPNLTNAGVTGVCHFAPNSVEFFFIYAEV